MDVVSSLRARRDVVDASRTVSLRPAGPRDDQFLHDLLADPRGGALLMPLDVREMLCDVRFREQRRRLEAAHPDAVREIVSLDGVDVGQVVTERLGEASDNGDDAEATLRVVELTVHRDHRRRGIATAVLRHLIARGRPVTLDVRPDDRAMLALGRQVGVVPIAPVVHRAGDLADAQH